MSGPIRETKSKVSMMVSKSHSTVANIGQKSMSRMKIRKQSYGFSGVPGIKNAERSSQVAFEFKRPPVIYLNTYQLVPHEPWNVTLVTEAAEDIVDDMFTGHKYNTESSPSLAIRLAGDIMRRVKAMNFNRYRVIVVVTIFQKRAQSYNNAIAFLWDYERDNYVDLQREESTASLQVTIFGIYLD